jgi:hypothetical protein
MLTLDLLLELEPHRLELGEVEVRQVVLEKVSASSSVIGLGNSPFLLWHG